MATKWKSRMRLALWALMFTLGLSGILTIFTVGEQYLYRDYFHTPEFQSSIDHFAKNVSLFELLATTEEEAKQNIVVTKDEIDEHRYKYGDLNEQISSIKGQYVQQIIEAEAANNPEAANALKEERDAKITDITKNFESDDYIEEKIIKEKEERITAFFTERESLRPSFSRMEQIYKYYFKDRATGEVYSNITKSEQKSVKDTMSEKNMLFATEYSMRGDYYSDLDIAGYELILKSIQPQQKREFEGYIAIKDTDSLAGMELEQYKNYLNIQKLMWIYSVVSVISLIGSLVYVKKAKPIPAEIEQLKPHYRKIPIDIRLILVGISIFAAILYLFMAVDQFYYLLDYPIRYGGEMAVDLTMSSIFWVLALIQVKLLYPVVKDWKQLEQEYRNSLLPKTWESVQAAFLVKKMGLQLFIKYGVIFTFSFLLALVTQYQNLSPLHYFMLLFCFIGIPTFAIQLIRTGYFNRIVQKTNELASGQLGPDLPVQGKSIYATLASNINVLKHGVKVSQNEQAKSERLKTELITNVSHDLRTPLTSIINYAELLKNSELTEEDRSAYLEIIDRKSKRLKVLIDDLFEVSKMASGNMELKLEKVDLVQLLQQTLAEYDEAITDSGLHFRVTHTEKPIYAVVDGQKLWRVFDNLIGNILKYSLENTRVFITVSKSADKAEITFKNISKFELGENSDELFERFKRGDTSRHTEGSGLGLAIAQSIVDLHEGDLSIEMDGDLFKVKIMLNLTD